MLPQCVRATTRGCLDSASDSKRGKFLPKTGKKCLAGEGIRGKPDGLDAHGEVTGFGPMGLFSSYGTFLPLDSPRDGGRYLVSVLGGSFIEPTQVKPGPALSSDVTP